jgi:hypothetical protein
MPAQAYLLSLPERVVRSALGLSAGVLREAGELLLPAGMRRSHLYHSLVEVTLRYVIEQVGGVKGTYPPEQREIDDFLLRRGAGNAIELLGIVAFRVSPVWVLAALADLSGLGRRLIPEISQVLAKEGLIEPGARYEDMDQLLDGMEKMSSRLAESVNTPPLNAQELRREWVAIRNHARTLKVALPSARTIGGQWNRLQQEATEQGRSVFEISSVMALSAMRALPDRARWLSASAHVGATYAGNQFAAAVLAHYSETLRELRQAGYLSYARRQMTPYLRACVEQFSQGRETLTQRMVAKVRDRQNRRRLRSKTPLR